MGRIEPKNILVIGNGFDLAHKLPTKYGNFLEFCKRVIAIYTCAEDRGIHLFQQEYLFKWEFNIEIKGMLEDAYRSRKNVEAVLNNGKRKSNIQTEYPKLDELYSHIEDNLWLGYFFQCNMYQKENWIDFESEIGRIIKSIDYDMKAGGVDENCIVKNITEEYFFKHFLDDFEVLEQAREDKLHEEICRLEKEEGTRWGILKCEEFREKWLEDNPIRPLKKAITYRQLIIRLEQDLQRLIRAFELYLTEFVEKISIEKISQQINNLNIDHVISFNYSHTYQKLYGKSSRIKYDYIHGEAKADGTLKNNNMVLGIDEYLPKKRRNKETNFIAFKKFYQRLYKATGCDYRNWVDEIIAGKTDTENQLKKRFPKQVPLEKFVTKHKLYFFGHSLDVTDKDILKRLILNDNVDTTIFYCKRYEDNDENKSHDEGKQDLGMKIANLVKVIGQDELIRRTGGSTQTIRFKLQDDF